MSRRGGNDASQNGYVSDRGVGRSGRLYTQDRTPTRPRPSMPVGGMAMTLARMAMPVGFLARPMSRRRQCTNTAVPPTTGRRSMRVGVTPAGRARTATTRIGVGARGRTTRRTPRRRSDCSRSSRTRRCIASRSSKSGYLSAAGAGERGEVPGSKSSKSGDRPAERGPVSAAGATEHSDLSETAARGAAEEGARLGRNNRSSATALMAGRPSFVSRYNRRYDGRGSFGGSLGRLFLCRKQRGKITGNSQP